MKILLLRASCVFLLSLFLCAPGSSLGGETKTDAKKLLSKNAGKKFKSRAILRTYAGARLSPDALSCPVQSPSGVDEEVIVVETGSMMRVVASPWDMRLLLYVPEESLSDVVVSTTTGASRPRKEDTGADAGFFDLFPGRIVEVLERSLEGTDVLVKINEGNLTLTGWIPQNAVGKVFVPSAKKPAKLPAKSRVFLTDGARILDGIDGAEQGQYQVESPDWMGDFLRGKQSVFKIGPVKSGYQLVEIRGDRYRARGFVEEGMLAPYEKASASGILAMLGTGGGGAFVTIKAGTYLRDAPGKDVVALVKQDHSYSSDPSFVLNVEPPPDTLLVPGISSALNGWTSLQYYLGGCTLDLWAPPEGVVQGEAASQGKK